ncbi:MAG: metalloregulator ArsR/SmtB family transcription factor [Candidatus Bathyarchaeia archaeon]
MFMNTTKINKRLSRLPEMGSCSLEKASEYAEELKDLADKELSNEKAEVRSKIFKALADPTRLRILGLLHAREMCVCEVMVALDLTQPTASHHLGILENVGLVKKRKEGKWVFYRLADPKKFGVLLDISF